MLCRCGPFQLLHSLSKSPNGLCLLPAFPTQSSYFSVYFMRLHLLVPWLRERSSSDIREVLFKPIEVYFYF
jgi:hypothetical protein